MLLVVRYALILLALLTVCAAEGSEIKLESLSAKELVDLKASLSSPDAIYIWDGDAELILLVRLVDSATQKPIRGAKIAAVRDRRVTRGPNGRAYKAVVTQQTDWRGDATLRGHLPAAGDATGFCVFVGDSYVSAESPGYIPARARISPIYRRDFPRKTKDCEVPIRLALKPK